MARLTDGSGEGAALTARPQGARLPAPPKTGKGGNHSRDRDHWNPEECGTDQDQQHDRGEKADDQHQEREAEWPNSADVEAMRAAALAKAIGRRPAGAAIARPAAARRNNLRFDARAFRLIWSFCHGFTAGGL